MAKLLMDAGADPEKRDLRGRTPAQAAAKTASFATLAMLFAKKPGDLLAQGTAASQARSKLKTRIGGRSFIEKIDIQDSVPIPEPKDKEVVKVPLKKRL
jgi:ankyrin repeat protein